MGDLLGIFRDDRFMPHGHCFLWTSDVLWTNVLSDLVIALAYYSIPIALFFFVRRRKDLEYNWIFYLFAAFILACGTTHLMEAWNIWHADYRFAGLLKAGTAGVSILTALLLWPLIPKLLAIPSPQQLKDANKHLSKEIEERRNVERALRDLNLELENRVQQRTSALKRSNEDLERFAYVASHDLQQPARTISTMLELLDKKLAGKLGAEEENYMTLVRQGSVKMSELIKALLDYSRLNARPTAFGLVDCDGVLDEALRSLDAAISASGVKITRGKLPSVTADKIQLLQFFQNMLGNAIKYRAKENPTIHVECKETMDHQIISVRDNGIGIDPRYHDRIFEMFKRLHSDEAYPGTGMGLAICRRIADAHGGELRLESDEGKGTCFYFSLPKNKLAA